MAWLPPTIERVQGLERAFDALTQQLDAIGWSALLLGISAHIAKIVARGRAWHGALQGAYPRHDVRWRVALGAYAAAVGANALLPARSGDVLRLHLVKRRVPGSSYTTLAGTLAVEAVFDVVAGALVVSWAIWRGYLPGIDVLPHLPDIDWLWLFERPRLAAGLAGAALVLGVAVGVGSVAKGRNVRDRLGQGVAVLNTPATYLRRVVLWQAVAWGLRALTIASFLAAFGLHPTLERAAAVQATQTAATLLPLTPAGIGTEQALLAYAMSGEAAPVRVLSFSVGMGLVLAAVNTGVGVIALLVTIRTLRWRQVVERETEAHRSRPSF